MRGGGSEGAMCTRYTIFTNIFIFTKSSVQNWLKLQLQLVVCKIASQQVMMEDKAKTLATVPLYQWFEIP